MSTSYNRKITPVRKAFGVQLRARREGLEMTQEELAEKADLHPISKSPELLSEEFDAWTNPFL